MYLRKSRSDNQFESVNEVLERHEQILQDYSMRTFLKPIPQTNIYREVVSGETISERPVMIKLLEDIEKGNIDAVIVVEPQRLSRGSFSDIDRIVNSFKYTDTKIITPSKTYDLNDKFDRKFFEQELLRGNDYLEYVKEILVRGKIRSVEDGLYIGSITPFGYSKTKLPKKGFTLVPNEDAETVKYIFDKFLSGMGTTTLARHLIEIGAKSQTGNRWTTGMIRNILMNKSYLGIVTYGKKRNKKTMKDGKIIKTRVFCDDYIEAKGLHPAIIKKEDFDKAQILLKPQPAKTIRSDKVLKNPLAGLVKCKYCDGTMKKKPYSYDINKSILCCDAIGCKCVSSSFELVEARVIELLKKELANYQYYISNYEKEIKTNDSFIKKELKKVDKELTLLKEDLQNALLKYNRNKITEEEYIFLREYTLKEESHLNEQKKALEDKIQTDELECKRKAIPILEKCVDEYFTLSTEDKHKLLCAIIDKIVYEKSQRGKRGATNINNSFVLELFLKI
jgi:DNA invertase Pin-like site-specific DNA recombinase